MTDEDKKKLGGNAYNKYISDRKYFYKRINILIDIINREKNN